MISFVLLKNLGVLPLHARVPPRLSKICSKNSEHASWFGCRIFKDVVNSSLPKAFLAVYLTYFKKEYVRSLWSENIIEFHRGTELQRTKKNCKRKALDGEKVISNLPYIEESVHVFQISEKLVLYESEFAGVLWHSSANCLPMPRKYGMAN